MLTYEDSTHSYFWNGFPIPSLSEMLVKTGWGRDFSSVPQLVLDRARIRGIQCHAAIDRYLSGDPGYAEELSDASEGYFESFLKVADDLPLTGIGVSELPVGGPCGYGTTPDRVEVNGLIEWKCTSYLHPSVFIQLAGQEYALLSKILRPRIAVLLKKTGARATVKEDPEPNLTMVLWMNSLEGLKWKERMKWR